MALSIRIAEGLGFFHFKMFQLGREEEGEDTTPLHIEQWPNKIKPGWTLNLMFTLSLVKRAILHPR